MDYILARLLEFLPKFNRFSCHLPDSLRTRALVVIVPRQEGHRASAMRVSRMVATKWEGWYFVLLRSSLRVPSADRLAAAFRRLPKFEGC
jgi:hypothetical protein